MDYLMEFRQYAGIRESSKLTQHGGKLPQTVRDWQLYSQMAGAEEAAQALTAALQAVEKEVRAKLAKLRLDDDDDDANRDAIGEVLSTAFRAFVAVQKKYSKVGAYDTEPRSTAMSYLDKVTDDVTGYDNIDF